MSLYRLTISKTVSRRYFLKFISAALVISFVGQEIGFAAPDGMAPKPLAKFNFSLPESVALIDEKYTAPNGDKSIILIRDAHTNESAELNIAKAIDLILKDNGKSKIENGNIKHVFLEAGTGNDSLSYLRRFATPEKREQVARSFLRRGLIQGPDYLDLTSDKAFSLWGVEKKPLYWEGLRLYRDLKKDRSFLNDSLDRLKRAKKTLVVRLWNSSLQKMDARRDAFLSGQISAADYLADLLSKSADLHLPMDLFPQLLKLASMKAKEKEINLEKASAEQARLIASLPAQDQKAFLDIAVQMRDSHSQESADVRDAFYSLLKEKIKTPFIYNHLSKYIEYVLESKAFNAAATLKEKADLEEIIFNRLARTSDEKRLLGAARATEN